MENLERLRDVKEANGKALTENLERLLTVKEASDATRLSKSKIYQLIEQQILRRVRLPGCAKVLIAEAELQRYISEGVKAGSVPASA